MIGSARPPCYSILTPVYNPDLDVLAETIRSVREQTYQDWEWVVVDDASPNPHVRAVLREASIADPRIVIVERATNGHIVAASNTGLAAAQGEFVALLDHDDLLAPHALERVHSVISAAPDIDYLYSDEDKLSGGRRFGAFHKPDWSPTRLRGHMYTGHLSVIRRSLMQEVGGFQTGFDGSQDHDLVLRVTERARRVVHVPDILYHWRLAEGSTAVDPSAKPYAWYAGGRAVDAHMKRLGFGGHGDILPGHVGYYRTWVDLPAERAVTVVIAASGVHVNTEGGRLPAFVPAVEGLARHTAHRCFDVVVVGDSRIPQGSLDRLEAAGIDVTLRRCSALESTSGRLNLGLLAARGDVIVFLGERTIPETPGFLDRLAGSLEEPAVGMVGPLVLGPANEIRHAGQRHHAGRFDVGFAGASHRDAGHWSGLWVAREVSGLALAAAAARRADLMTVGGLAEAMTDAAAEVDLSLKIRSLGLRTVWVPDVWARTSEPWNARAVDDRGTEELVARWGKPRWDPYLPD